MPIQVRRFECRNYRSNKFWECWINKTVFHAMWGPIGQDPRRQEKKFHSVWQAEDHRRKKIKEKRTKGYVEVAGREIKKKTPKPVKPRQTEVEEALLKALTDQVEAELKASGHAIDAEVTAAMSKSLKTLRRQIRENNLVPTPAHLLDLTYRELDFEEGKEVPDGIEKIERFEMLEFD